MPLFFLFACLFLFSSVGYGQDPIDEDSIMPDLAQAQADQEDMAMDETAPADNEMAGGNMAANGDAGEGDEVQDNINRVLPNPASRRAAEVIKHLKLYQRDKEILSFSDSADSINGLYIPENTGKPQGGVLVLHDIDHHAHWPNTIGPIREYLPDYGWTTLSLFFGNHIKRPLPKIPDRNAASETTNDDTDAPENTEPEAPVLAEGEALTEDVLSEASDAVDDPEADQNFEDEPQDELDEIADNIDNVDDFMSEDDDSMEEASGDDSLEVDKILLQNMQERVDIGISQLNNLGQYNLVIIAQGMSANWAVASLMERYKTNPELVGYALILIDAQKSTYPEYDLNEKLATLQIPILDIHTSKEPQVLRKTIERRNAIRRSQNKRYWQIQLPAVRSRLPQKHNMISRRVRGWLNTHAAGEEVNVEG